MPPYPAMRITQVAWLGYDAVLDGEEIVVVYHEETLDGWAYYPTIDGLGLPVPMAGGDVEASAPFVPAVPPPLAPGLTEPVPAPSDAHKGKLILLRLL